MTSVRLFLEAGELVGLEAQGHAGFAPRGRDIVCAAVSVLVQTLELGMEDVIREPSLRIQCDSHKALRRVIWKRSDDPRVTALGETIRLALKAVAEAHPKQVCIVEVERDEANS